MTFTLPTGTKLRYQGHFRYVLCYDWQGKGVIVKRSDNADTLRRVAARQDFIIDTTTGRNIK